MTPITVSTIVQAPVDHVWATWNNPEDIMQWAFASDDWHAPAATNDLRVGGTFVTTMAAKDGSTSFDFSGVYSVVEENERIEYAMADGRKVTVSFEDMGDATKVTEIFDPENVYPVEQQKAGWQAILDNFKMHAESTAQ